MLRRVSWFTICIYNHMCSYVLIWWDTLFDLSDRVCGSGPVSSSTDCILNSLSASWKESFVCIWFFLRWFFLSCYVFHDFLISFSFLVLGSVTSSTTVWVCLFSPILSRKITSRLTFTRFILITNNWNAFDSSEYLTKINFSAVSFSFFLCSLCTNTCASQPKVCSYLTFRRLEYHNSYGVFSVVLVGNLFCK